MSTKTAVQRHIFKYICKTYSKQSLAFKLLSNYCYKRSIITLSYIPCTFALFQPSRLQEIVCSFLSHCTKFFSQQNCITLTYYGTTTDHLHQHLPRGLWFASTCVSWGELFAFSSPLHLSSACASVPEKYFDVIILLLCQFSTRIQ